MKKVFFIIILSIVLQNCSSNIESTNTVSNDITSVTKKQYLQMTKEEKRLFKNKYVAVLTSGEPCSCESTGTDSNGNPSSCACNSGNCPDATKPKCQCASGACDCGCEPYGRTVLKLLYTIQQNSDSYILMKHTTSKALEALQTSNLPNAKKLYELLVNEFQKEHIVLTESEYVQIESKFQNLVKDYTALELFQLEYEL